MFNEGGSLSISANSVSLPVSTGSSYSHVIEVQEFHDKPYYQHIALDQYHHNPSPSHLPFLPRKPKQKLQHHPTSRHTKTSYNPNHPQTKAQHLLPSQIIVNHLPHNNVPRQHTSTSISRIQPYVFTAHIFSTPSVPHSPSSPRLASHSLPILLFHCTVLLCKPSLLFNSNSLPSLSPAMYLSYSQNYALLPPNLST